MGKNILFVCTGNTCRSTMAEAIALQLISDNKDKFGNLWIASAGTHAMDGLPASEQAVIVGQEVGIDLSGHRAKTITPQLIEGADIILTMTNSHKQQILRLAPEVAGKTFLLKEYSSSLGEKEDYYQMAQAIYQRIEKKQKEFYQKHKATLEALEQKKLQLETELEAVINEIGKWEALLYQETYGEQQELQRLERTYLNQEVIDPFGQPVETYRRCFQELYQEVSTALEKIAQESHE